jgi:hypothetical protein
MTRLSMCARPLHAALVWAALALGCTGDLSPRPPSPGDTNVGGAGGRSPEEGGYDDEFAGGLSDVPAPSTRFARLTHAQWRNTVRDLFGLSEADVATIAEALRADASQGGFLFDNQGQTLTVDEALWGGYRRAAADVAERVTTDSALLSNVVRGETDARTLIGTLGLRVYRRPLSDTELSEHATLFAAARDLYESVDAFTAGVRVTIEAMLQSPLFVYRVEQSDQTAGAVIPLNAFEVASRLSYFLWNTLPDEALFEAAQTDALLRASTVADQAERMLDDPRARDVIKSFHEQVFETAKLANITPSPAFYEGVSATLGASAQREQELFIQNVVVDGALGLGELLTSSETYVNDDLARAYGLSGSFGAEHVPVSLDPATRSGILTQVGFLAAHATSVEPDPIHRGVFVARRIACMNLPAPPDNIPPLPNIDGLTNRARVAQHTEQEGSVCAGCHATTINPFGFPFESYDAIGAFRTEDSGQPVDTSASPLIDGKPTPVADALELSQRLADSASVHACYVKHWLEFAHGRPEANADTHQIDRLAVASRGGDLSVRKLLVALIASEGFLTRSTQELP